MKISSWQTVKRDKSHYYYSCENCGCISRYKKSIYCPECGSRMIDKVAGNEK